MFDLQKIYHTGLSVPDIEAAKKLYGESMGLEWAPVRTFDPLPFWTPERGNHELVVSATYSRVGPHHFELVQGPVGSYYDPQLSPDKRHIGVWVDDLPAEAARLIGLGWRVIGAAAAPEEGYGILAYLEPPMGGFVVELVATALKPAIDEWLAAAD